MSPQAAAPENLTSAHVDWFLAITRMNGLRRRVEAEGLTEEIALAFQETIATATGALARISAQRGVPSYDRGSLRA